MKKIERLTNIGGKLLEGCVWDEREQKLYFVDIECRKIYCLETHEKKLSYMEVPGYVSCIVLEDTGNIVAALPDGLYRVNFTNKVLKRIMKIQLREGFRFNDGKCDADGNLWIGSMGFGENGVIEGAGKLFCIRHEQVLREYAGYTIPNGLAWSRDAVYFYHVDTPKKRIDEWQVDRETSLAQRRTAVDLSEEEGSPDGMCMDEQGRLWIAMWGGGCVICADPKTGELSERINVPDRYPSCCTFGGSNMDRLYITTARDEQGSGGELYVEQMKTKGVTANRYGK